MPIRYEGMLDSILYNKEFNYASDSTIEGALTRLHKQWNDLAMSTTEAADALQGLISSFMTTLNEEYLEENPDTYEISFDELMGFNTDEH